jgi:hypothetical protein
MKSGMKSQGGAPTKIVGGAPTKIVGGAPTRGAPTKYEIRMQCKLKNGIIKILK